MSISFHSTIFVKHTESAVCSVGVFIFLDNFLEKFICIGKGFHMAVKSNRIGFAVMCGERKVSIGTFKYDVAYIT